MVAMSSAPASAQTSNDNLMAKTPESEFLELVDLVEEPKKQIDLLTAFQSQFPKYEGMAAIHAQMQGIFVDLKQWDKSIAAGEKALSLDPNNVEVVKLIVQAAEEKKDETLLAKWRDRLKALQPETDVTVASNEHLPFIDDEPAGDLDKVDLTTVPKQQMARLEAIVFNRALSEKDYKRKLQLLSLFEKEFPKSQRIASIRYLFYLTYREKEDTKKALKAAEALLDIDRTHEDVLFYLAQVYFAGQRDSAKVLSYSVAIQQIVATKARPDNIPADTWEKQKHTLMQQTTYMTAMIRVNQENWPAADKALRTALTYVPADSDLSANILNNLGWANFKIGNPREALRFYQQCASIRSSVQAAALQSLAFIKSQLNLP